MKHYSEIFCLDINGACDTRVENCNYCCNIIFEGFQET